MLVPTLLPWFAIAALGAVLGWRKPLSTLIGAGVFLGCLCCIRGTAAYVLFKVSGGGHLSPHLETECRIMWTLAKVSGGFLAGAVPTTAAWLYKKKYLAPTLPA
jgi:hypothetical protein